MNAYTYYTDGRAATEATTNRANYNAVMFQLLGISSTPRPARPAASRVGINWEHRRILHRALAQERDDSFDDISVSDSEDSDSDSDSEDSVNEDNSLIEGNPGGFVRRISFTESEFSLDEADYDALLTALNDEAPDARAPVQAALDLAVAARHRAVAAARLLRELDVPPPNQSTDQHTTDHPVGHQELRQ